MKVGNMHFMAAGQLFEYVVVPGRYRVVEVILC
jgi:hypothetical protein